MDNTLSYFVYCPPKSNSHGHSVRNKNVRRATQKLIDSFIRCFNATTDNKIDLTLHYDKSIKIQNINQTIEKFNEFLSISKKEHCNISSVSTMDTMIWKFENANILDLLEYVDNFREVIFLPSYKYFISCFYQYGKSPEPWGQIMVSIESGKLFVRLFLTVPYSIDTEKCYNLIYELNKLLPFKLNCNHFRRLGPNERRYGLWKLDEETKHKLNECLVKSKMK